MADKLLKKFQTAVNGKKLDQANDLLTELNVSSNNNVRVGNKPVNTGSSSLPVETILPDLDDIRKNLKFLKNKKKKMRPPIRRQVST